MASFGAAGQHEHVGELQAHPRVAQALAELGAQDLDRLAVLLAGDQVGEALFLRSAEPAGPWQTSAPRASIGARDSA